MQTIQLRSSGLEVSRPCLGVCMATRMNCADHP
jgi:hypothetical protein